MKRFSLLLLALAAVACKKGSTNSEPVASVSVAPATAGVGVGDTVRLTATPRDANNQPVSRSVSWTSLNPGIATVDNSGLVRGVAVGTATIQASSGGRTGTASVNVVGGTLRNFNVNANSACSSPITKSGRLVAQSARVQIYEDITNPAGGPTEAQYQNVANTVEAAVYDVNVANFGAPTDIDGNGKIIVLYTRAVNELTPAGAGYVVGGFMYARDLFPTTASGGLPACPASNVAEMFYMLSADPTGSINGNARSVAYVLGSTVGIVAHEFQHVINAGRRLRIVRTVDWEETAWLNEGLSHIAEELTFYGASGRAPKQNLNLTDVLTAGPVFDAFSAYGVANIDRFDTYLEASRQYGPYEDNDELENRGAIWALLRYAADRKGGVESAFWQSLVNSTPRGLPNLQAAYGSDPMVLSRDWSIANYTDDAVPGIASIYTHPSWNFRSIMTHARWGGYGLQVTPLTSGVAANATIRAGSAAYFRFGVAPAGTGDVRVSLGGTTEPGTCTTVNLAAGGVYHGGPTPSALCMPGGATGAEYVVITHNGTREAESASSNVAVTVVGTGIVAPTPPPTPTPSFDFGDLNRFIPAHANDGGFEGRLRRREREQLGALFPRREPAVLADPVVAGVSINVVRIR